MANRYVRRHDGTTGTIPQDNIVVVQLIATSVDANIFIADTPCQVEFVREAHSVVGGASAAVDVKKCTGTTAPASGTSVLASTFDLTATANTVVSKVPGSGLTATRADRVLAAGDRLAIDMSGTLTGLVGVLEIGIRRLQSTNDVR